MSFQTSDSNSIIDNFEADIPISQVVKTLCEVTSRRLVAVTTGVTKAETIVDWQQEKYTLSESQREKLITLYNIVKMLQKFEDDFSIYAFLMGRSPEMGDISPAEAIRAGKYSGAWAAAKNYVADE